MLVTPAADFVLSQRTVHARALHGRRFEADLDPCDALDLIH